jgi:hypothetical protein
LELGLPGASYINDVAISKDKVYFTDSFNPILYQVPRFWGAGSPDISHPIVNLLGAPAAAARPFSKIHTGPFFDTKPGQFRANGAAVYRSDDREDVLLVACTHTGNVYKVVVNKLPAADTPTGPASVAVAAAATAEHLSKATADAASDFLTGLESLQRPSVAPAELATLAAHQSAAAAAAPATVGIASLPLRTKSGKSAGKQSSKWAQLAQEVKQDLDRTAASAQQAIRTAGMKPAQQAAVSTASIDSAEALPGALPGALASAIRPMSVKDAAVVAVKAGEAVKLLGQIAKGVGAQIQQIQTKDKAPKPDHEKKEHHGHREHKPRHGHHALRHYMHEHPIEGSSSSIRRTAARPSRAPAAGSGGVKVQTMSQFTSPSQVDPAAAAAEAQATKATASAVKPGVPLAFPARDFAFTARPAAQAFVQAGAGNSRILMDDSADDGSSSSSSSSSTSLDEEGDLDDNSGAPAAADKSNAFSRHLLAAVEPMLLADPIKVPERVPDVNPTLRKEAAAVAAKAAVAAEHVRGLGFSRGLLSADAASEAESMDVSPAQIARGIAGKLPWPGKKYPAAEVTELPLPSIPGRFSQRLLVDGIVMTPDGAFVADNYNNRVWGLQLGEGLSDARVACDFQGPPMQVPTTLALQGGRLWWVNAHLDTCFPFLPCPLHTFELHGVSPDLCQPWG